MVATRLYTIMFDEAPPSRRSVDQLRGIEGARVRKILEEFATKHGIHWTKRIQSGRLDPINLAINTATAALYGITEAVILGLGFSPAIGFIHRGDPRSFVFDLADVIKFKTVVPLAFEICKESEHNLEQRVRSGCRELFRELRLVETLINYLEVIFDDNGVD